MTHVDFVKNEWLAGYQECVGRASVCYPSQPDSGALVLAAISEKYGRGSYWFVTQPHDETTGKTVGWEPVGQSSFAKWMPPPGLSYQPGSYELCGPKINGDPEGFGCHVLVRHGLVELVAPLTFDELRDALLSEPFEGIVWHHPDGRMAKLKKRDFPYSHLSSQPENP